jgi:Xaa-Pro aminopeptidase
MVMTQHFARKILAAATATTIFTGTVPAAAQAQSPLGGTAVEVPALPPVAPVSAAEYATRRSAVTGSLGEGVFLALGAPAPAADYLPFTQDQAFRYLTGITEPAAALVIAKRGDTVHEWLFVQAKDPAREVWEGDRLGAAGAAALTGVHAEPRDRLMPILDSLLAEHGTLYSLTEPRFGADADVNVPYEHQVLARVREKHPDVRMQGVAREIMALRALKTDAELDRIRRAAYISALAHREAMKATAPGMNEFEIEALVEYTFGRNGGDGPAYASIVGSGPNSTTLHYNRNSRFMNDGEVLLFDVATAYEGYAADITRTVPVNGTYSPEQRAIYGVVLAAQKAAESKFAPGATWRELNEAANAEIADGLARLGLIDAADATYQCGQTAENQCPQTRLFYMHGLGHGLGLAVHDPDVGSAGGFRPGTAITIEPGIYVRETVFDHIPDSPENRAMIERLRAAQRKYVNIGVRIEDVFIMDENGVERASAAAPRELDEIEALMREQSFTDPARLPDVVHWKRKT